MYDSRFLFVRGYVYLDGKVNPLKGQQKLSISGSLASTDCGANIRFYLGLFGATGRFMLDTR